MSIDIFSLLQTIPNHNPHYLKRYYNLVKSWDKVNSMKTKEELGYSENHHILPVSMFPDYKSLKQFPTNKAVLTFPQHIIAHFLLYKAFPDIVKMLFAVNRMLNQDKLDIPKIPTSAQIKRAEQVRIEFSAAIGAVLSAANKGNSRSDETRAKISAGNKGKVPTNEHRAKNSAA